MEDTFESREGQILDDTMRGETHMGSRQFWRGGGRRF